jgi:NAD(P)-dependent dehydrogenase (short-subunit alcohol dehydrogenase family)
VTVNDDSCDLLSVLSYTGRADQGGMLEIRVGAGDELVRWVGEELGRLDLLVNNAGFGKQSWFHEMEPDVTGRMFQVNVLSPMELSRAAIPLMRRGSGGSIVNVASVGGVVSHPLNVAYCASKHALVGFSKSLRLELKGSGINVVAVCPAATRTEFFEQARGEIPFDTMIESNWVPADTVARAVVRSEHSHRAVVFPTWGAWFLAWADRWLPWASELGNLRYRDRVMAAARAVLIGAPDQGDVGAVRQPSRGRRTPARDAPER